MRSVYPPQPGFHCGQIGVRGTRGFAANHRAPGDMEGMTKHLVSTLKRSELYALCDELEMRLEVADRVLDRYAKRKNVEIEALARDFVCCVVSASLSGAGFAAEEVRGMVRTPVRMRRELDEA